MALDRILHGERRPRSVAEVFAEGNISGTRTATRFYHLARDGGSAEDDALASAWIMWLDVNKGFNSLKYPSVNAALARPGMLLSA